jgi:probable HAF family extracellular repeat protein
LKVVVGRIDAFFTGGADMTRTIYCICLVLLLASLAAAQSYTVTDLGVLAGDVSTEGRAISPSGQVVGDAENDLQGFYWSTTDGLLGLPHVPGGAYSVAMGINATGLIAGYSTYNEIESEHAVLWFNGKVRDLGTLPGGDDSWANALNDSGQVVGASNSAKTQPNAFLWSKAKGMFDLGVLPKGFYSEAFGINKLGQVVGMSNTIGGNWHAFSWSKSAGMVDLGTLDSGKSTGAVANGVNDSGQIVGTSSCGSSCTHAALWTATGIQDLGTLPGSSISAANGINNRGQVVGESGHAFVWSQATGMQDLNSLIPQDSGWTLTWAFAINDNGQITGQGEINGQTHAYLLTPQ